jgi:hypothetical protein
MKGDRSADYRDQTTRVIIVNAITLVITVRHLLDSSEAPFAESDYLLSWPFLRLTDPFQFSKCPFDETMLPSMRILPFLALIFSALLAACASEISNPLMGGAFVDPGKYEFYSCDQIAANRKDVEKRAQELKLLMEKAEKGAGGAVVSVIAYKGEYVATQDELKVIDATARDKKCKTPENWSSTSAIR